MSAIHRSHQLGVSGQPLKWLCGERVTKRKSYQARREANRDIGERATVGILQYGESGL